MTDRYHVKLEGFEGPLDLLLHLINRYEIDIYDIPVSTITEQYMNYIHTMQELELNVASEYLVMAATLLAIKSQMLLPSPSLNEEFEAEDTEDPREELISRLIEYKKYKKAAEQLKTKEVEENRIYTRPQMNVEQNEYDGPVVKEGEASVFEMVSAVQQMLKNNKHKAPGETKIKRDEVSIQLRMDDILSKIRVSREGTRFYDLFEEKTRSHIVVSFIAILELMKNNEIICTQSEHFEELIVFRSKV
ncbi:segregation/condensation protein A [Halobacillus sp. A5]|uniref:segregation/condensation protein A n=1 Tax=Halobacillus sp. A5 TaxID=2880263 RepID=UPI0020A6227C|nr:segregation/condensation protein A [Halobacillus sp. A5]MCP3025807.1 segregation/condensation protein A [Halobacillus sp. A5]